MRARFLPLVLPLLLAPLRPAADPPLEAGNAKTLRPRLVDQARRYLGAPYRSGGYGPAGFDCSGLVSRVYADVTGRRLPRTVRALYGYCEPVPRSQLEEGDLVFFDTTGRLTHIGLYIGDSRLIHAASEGDRPGVIVSSLDEPYYRSRFAGGGRLLPSAGWLGFLVRLGASPVFGALPIVGEQGLIRGAAASGQAWYNLFGVYVGLETRLEYDAATHLAVFPLLLNVSFNRRVWFLLGTTAALGSGEYAGGGGCRVYRPDGAPFLDTVGAGVELANLRIGGLDTGLFSELTWTSHELAGEDAPEFATDALIGLKAYLGVSVTLRY